MPSPRKKPKKGAPAAPPLPHQKRVAWLERHLARGIRPTALVQMAVEEWGVSESVIWRMFPEIRERWATESAASRPVARSEILTQVDALIADAYADHDLKTVTRALGLKAELYGLRLKAVTEETGQASALSLPNYLTTPRTESSAPESDEP